MHQVGNQSRCFQHVFEHPSFHTQEDLYMQFYGISFMHPYKQSGRWRDGHRPDCLYGSYYIGISQCTVQKKKNVELAQLVILRTG